VCSADLIYIRGIGVYINIHKRAYAGLFRTELPLRYIIKLHHPQTLYYTHTHTHTHEGASSLGINTCIMHALYIVLHEFAANLINN